MRREGVTEKQEERIWNTVDFGQGSALGTVTGTSLVKNISVFLSYVGCSL